MAILKEAKDYIAKRLAPRGYVPRGLVELSDYFRHYDVIEFRYERGLDGRLIAVSNNFRFGSIITSGKDQEELDRNIKDAILTSFEIPSAYAPEAKLHKTGESKAGVYALS